MYEICDFWLNQPTKRVYFEHWLCAGELFWGCHDRVSAVSKSPKSVNSTAILRNCPKLIFKLTQNMLSWTDVLPWSTISWQFLLGAIFQFMLDCCFLTCSYHWSMSTATFTDEDRLENIMMGLRNATVKWFTLKNK